MRVSSLEAALLALHTGDDRAVLRSSERRVSESCGDLQFGFGGGKNCRDLLRGGMDATLQRRADHSHRSDSANAAGKYRAARRRNSGAAWPCVNSRIDGCAYAL